jgi:hypothetical protein
MGMGKVTDDRRQYLIIYQLTKSLTSKNFFQNKFFFYNLNVRIVDDEEALWDGV